jgi:hypothetical protein
MPVAHALQGLSSQQGTLATTTEKENVAVAVGFGLFDAQLEEPAGEAQGSGRCAAGPLIVLADIDEQGTAGLANKGIGGSDFRNAEAQSGQPTFPIQTFKHARLLDEGDAYFSRRFALRIMR